MGLRCEITKLMDKLFNKSVISFGALSAVLLLVMLSAFFIVSNVTHAGSVKTQGDGRILTIYDRGYEKRMVSQAATIGDALRESGISIDEKDVVEPSLSQKMVASDYQINIYRARPVIIIDGNIRTKIVTAYQTPEQIAAEAGIKLFDEDRSALGLSDDILADGAGLKLTINRATPFMFTLYGKVMTARTFSKTVGEMLIEKGIKLTASDKVTPEINTPINEGLAIRVWREGKDIVNVDEVINFDTDKIEDVDQPIGYSLIRIAGEPGSRSVSYEITIQDGLEVGRSEIASIITKQPKKQIEVIGSKLALSKGYSAERVSIMDSAGVSEGDQGYAAYIIDNENGLWCPTRWQGQSGCPAAYQEKFPGAEGSDQVGYGLCQSTPGNKMASAGSDWRTNPVTQMKWCAQYALSRYSTWKSAYDFKVRVGWW